MGRERAVHVEIKLAGEDGYGETAYARECGRLGGIYRLQRLVVKRMRLGGGLFGLRWLTWARTVGGGAGGRPGWRGGLGAGRGVVSGEGPSSAKSGAEVATWLAKEAGRHPPAAYGASRERERETWHLRIVFQYLKSPGTSL